MTNEQQPINSCSSTTSQFVHQYSPNCQEVEYHLEFLEGMVQGFKQSLNRLPQTDLRKKLWIDVAVAVAAASNSTTKYTMEKWADHALAEFDKRFKD